MDGPFPGGRNPQPQGGKSPGRARARDLSARALLASLPATVWLTDDTLTLRFVQGRLLQRLRLDADQLIGRTLPVILLDGREDHPLVEAHLTALAGRDASIRIEWGGDLYHASIAPVRDESGRVIGCAGVQQRIGWRPDDEGLLRESDIRLQRVVDSNMIGIVFGNADGAITDANEAFLQLVGAGRELLTTGELSWPSLTPIEAHARHVAAIAEIAERGRCTPFETELLRADGTRVPVMVGGARLSASRREGVAFVLDMTERRRDVARLEAELASADALADAPGFDEAAGTIVEACCRLLGWRLARIWLRRRGPLELVATAGDAGVAADLDRLGERAARARAPIWIAPAATFAAPLAGRAGCRGALVLIGRPGAETCQALLDTSRRIANRISRHLSRRDEHP